MSSSRLARARVLQGEEAGSAPPVYWPTIGDGHPRGGPAISFAGATDASRLPGAAPREDQFDGSGRQARRSTNRKEALAVEAPPDLPVCDCQNQIETVRREAMLALEQARAAAISEGQRAGEQRGRQQAAAELEPLMARLLRTIEDLSGTRDAFRREAEEDIVRLALGIARRVVHREVSMDSAVLLGVIRAALDKIGARELHRVLVATADQPVIAAGIESLRLSRRVDVVADANLERGAVLFETVKGSLDASLETQLDEIERGLVDALGRRSR
jgi:flagellar assembly protein FliH